MTGSEVEAALDGIRRQLAKAQTAQEILTAGQPIAALIDAIEEDLARLSGEIAAEADNVDRGRTNTLRAEWNSFSDLMTDTENLSRRIDERHDAALKAEADASMQALRASGLEKQAEILALITGLEPHVRSVVDGFSRYRQLSKDIERVRRQLEAAKRDDIQLPLLWRGIAQAGDDPIRLFDFLNIDERQRAPAGHFFTFVERIRAASEVKADAQAPAIGLVAGIRSLVKRAS